MVEENRPGPYQASISEPTDFLISGFTTGIQLSCDLGSSQTIQSEKGRMEVHLCKVINVCKLLNSQLGAFNISK